MEVYPTHGRIRVLAIDPGTDTLGCVVVEVDLATHHPHLIYAETVTAHQHIKHRQALVAAHGERFVRLLVLQDYIRAVTKMYRPHVAGVETPYLGRNPSTYASLSEAFFAIRQGMASADDSLVMHGIKPMQGKEAVGAATPEGTKKRKRRGKVVETKVHVKETVQQAVLKRVAAGVLTADAHIDVEALDEHAIDAIAVCFAVLGKVGITCPGAAES